MFFDGSFFFFKEFCRPLSEEHSCKKKKCYPISGLGGEDFKRFFTLVAMATRIIHGTQLFEGI